MPYPNEHSARIRDPGDFEEKSFRRKELTPGIIAIMGWLKGEKTMTIQAYRLDKEKFTPDEAKEWLKKHDIKFVNFEAAKETEKKYAEMKEIEIFRAGKHIDMSGAEIDFSEEVVQQIVGTYDSDIFEAPLTIGHPNTNDPAFGWIKRLSLTGDKKIKAFADQIHPEFEKMVRAGSFKKVSASFYTPESPNNPLKETGLPKGFYLRHVGFLGAQAPAIKGLKIPAFKEDEQGTIAFEFSEIPDFSEHSESMVIRALRKIREWILGKWNKDEADKAIPPDELENLENMNTWESRNKAIEAVRNETKNSTNEIKLKEVENMPFEKEKEEIEKKTQELTKKELAFAERETKLKEAEMKTKKAEIVSWIEEQVKTGKVLPVHKSGMSAFLESVSTLGLIEFGETKTNQLDWFKKFISELPVIVTFGETKLGDIPKDFIEMEPAEIARKIEEIQFSEKQKGREITAAQALSILTKEVKK